MRRRARATHPSYARPLELNASPPYRSFPRLALLAPSAILLVLCGTQDLYAPLPESSHYPLFLWQYPSAPSIWRHPSPPPLHPLPSSNPYHKSVEGPFVIGSYIVQLEHAALCCHAEHQALKGRKETWWQRESGEVGREGEGKRRGRVGEAWRRGEARDVGQKGKRQGAETGNRTGAS